jgi:hypothetical protein
MQSMGVSSAKELFLMSSALKDTGSTAKWRKIRQRILNRDGHTCQHCGMEGNSVDHIIPRQSGGTDDEWNLLRPIIEAGYNRPGGVGTVGSAQAVPAAVSASSVRVTKPASRVRAAAAIAAKPNRQALSRNAKNRP